MLKSRRAPLTGLVSLLLVACGGTTTVSTPNYAGKTIRLGAVISLSGAGAIYGSQQKQGIDLAVDTINNRGGVNGAKISMVVQDDKSDRAQSVAGVQTLIKTGKVVGIIGPTLSNSAVAANPMAQSLRTPIMAISSTGAHVVGDCPIGDCNFIFRDSLGEAAAIPDNVKAAVNRYHPRSAVIFFANDDKSSFDGVNIFRQALADNGVSIADGGVLQFAKTETDFSTPVTTAKSKNAGVWVISALGAIPAKIMIEARKQGYTGPFIGGDGLNSNQVSQQAGEQGRGAQSASAYYVGSADPANKAFVDSYRARYKDAKGNPQLPDEIAAQAYSAVLIYAEAARLADLTFGDLAKDRESIRSALEKVSIDTPLGHFKFTPAHDVNQKVWINAMDGKGSFVNITSFQGG